jgi:hypothetical protein
MFSLLAEYAHMKGLLENNTAKSIQQAYNFNALALASDRGYSSGNYHFLIGLLFNNSPAPKRYF